MKLSQVKEFLPFIQALAEGKTVEWQSLTGSWIELQPSSEHFMTSDAGRYRIKPTPTLRPWRPEEVPVGAIVRDPKYNSVWLITALWEQHKGSGDYRVFLNGGNYEEGHKLEYFTDDKMLYSLDHGVSWKPCGILCEK